MPARGIAIALAAVLVGCAGSPKRQHHSDGDYAPPDPPPGLEQLPDPQPRVEPPSRYGNPESYEVHGRRYYVARTAEGYRERGLASWYGAKFHGRRTSSGEPFDMYKLTAAHRSLPLPTYVRVTHLGNGRSVIVRVNDRGPFNERRIIDLSYAAAVRLGMVDEGEAPVEVVALTSPDPNAARIAVAHEAAETEPVPRFVETERWEDPISAVAVREALAEAGVRPLELRVSHEMGTWHRIRIGPITDARTFRRIREVLAGLGVRWRPSD